MLDAEAADRLRKVRVLHFLPQSSKSLDVFPLQCQLLLHPLPLSPRRLEARRPKPSASLLILVAVADVVQTLTQKRSTSCPYSLLQYPHSLLHLSEGFVLFNRSLHPPLQLLYWPLNPRCSPRFPEEHIHDFVPANLVPKLGQPREGSSCEHRRYYAPSAHVARARGSFCAAKDRKHPKPPPSHAANMVDFVSEGWRHVQHLLDLPLFAVLHQNVEDERDRACLV
mmetsp:Transcript_40736/g.96733  ORF Transcript_40736/g.96733 Transcript_40736/m.96733 type:complete len:225 (+) Transcript_40736:1166-1840(+)